MGVLLPVLLEVGVSKKDGDGMLDCDCAVPGGKRGGCAVVAVGAVTVAITGLAKKIC